MFEENHIAKEAVDAAIKLHKQFGPGVYESVYEPLIIPELKSVEKLRPAHFKQLLTYPRLTGLRAGS